MKGLAVYGENEMHERACVKVDDGKITAVGEEKEIQTGDGRRVFHFPEAYSCIPGMIDVHIHGAGGADTMDATYEALDTMRTVLPREGTTSFLATTMTQQAGAVEKAVANVAEYIDQANDTGAAEIVGIHLEGPFISEKKAGAQPPASIHPPDISLFQRWQRLADNRIKLVTLAPEKDGGLELVKYLHSHGIVASIGHSNATYDEVSDAIEAGATHVTHLFNGMSGLHHREPGVVGAALLRDELYAELIVDGIHSRPETVKLAYREKGRGRIILITDAIRAKCLRDGQYDLGGQRVYVTADRAKLANGSLAGSVLRMEEALKKMMAFADVGLSDVIHMAAVNPAKQLGIFHKKGSIHPGKDADLVVLDKNHEVVMTFCRGVLAFRKEERTHEDHPGEESLGNE
ncbi:MAG TPA: N-acetylglucosamine-6-phosphate deacetylase [Bacillales bacterium]|nr:N-acetylglucosamine-6-phosphate deacetylase [Bacillales bacterium]